MQNGSLFNNVTIALLLLHMSTQVQSQSFWQEKKPEDYTREITTVMLMLYFGVDCKSCDDSIIKDPKLFTKIYDNSVDQMTKFSNETFEQVYNELKEIDNEQHKKQEYLFWLYMVAKSFVSQRNYSAASTIALVISLGLNYKLISNSFNEGIVGVKKNKLQTLFSNHINHRGVLKFEGNQQLNNINFIPSFIGIRRELEFLSNQDFKDRYNAIERKKIAQSICKKISKENFIKYKKQILTNI